MADEPERHALSATDDPFHPPDPLEADDRVGDWALGGRRQLLESVPRAMHELASTDDARLNACVRRRVLLDVSERRLRDRTSSGVGVLAGRFG